MRDEQLRLNTTVSIAEVPGTVCALEAFWVRRGVHPDDLPDLAVAAEEMISNVVRHGGASRLEVRTCCSGGEARIEIEDDGVEFNPAAYPQADIHAPLEERRVGGLGILMVRRMMDSVQWTRQDGRNIFTFTMAKRLASRSGADAPDAQQA